MKPKPKKTTNAKEGDAAVEAPKEGEEVEVDEKAAKEFANPIMDYSKNIIFNAQSKMDILRKPENGGDITYYSYEDLEKDYLEGKVHPGDLKAAVKIALNKLIQPVRDHFQTDPVAKQLLAQIKLWQEQKLQKDLAEKQKREQAAKAE